MFWSQSLTLTTTSNGREETALSVLKEKISGKKPCTGDSESLELCASEGVFRDMAETMSERAHIARMVSCTVTPFSCLGSNSGTQNLDVAVAEQTVCA